MNEHDTILELVQRYADGIANENETLRLQKLLQGDIEARRLFRSYMELDASLVNLGDAAALCDSESERPELQQVEEGPIVTSQVTTRILFVAIAVACSLLVVAGLWRANTRPVVWATVSEVGSGVSILRDLQTRPAEAGDSLRADEQIVVSQNGSARVAVAGLGVVSLGPEARLRSGSESRLIELNAGFASIVAENPTAGHPWRIRTPQAEAAVLGTVFNIASANGRTALRVTEGIVRLTSLQDGQSERIRGGNRAIVTREAMLDVATSRPGSVLLLTSREPPSSHWDRFNQIVIDKLVNDRMWRLGFRVDVRHYETVQAIDLRHRSLVIVSLFDYGVGEPAIERIGLAEYDIPVLCLEPAAYPTLGMTVGVNGVGFGFRDGTSAVEFSDSSHPLSGGCLGSQNNIIRGQIGWGRPANEAERIAHLPGKPDESILFAYDNGRQMATHSAPARRVGLFLDPTGISEDTQEVWTVFEAAVDWCVATGETL